jgi:signal peptidase II
MSPIPLKLKLFLPVFAVTFAIDQWTKSWILARFSYGEEQVVIPGFFNLTHVRNPGGAFSFLATLPGELRQVFFLGTGLLAIVLLLVFLRRIEARDWIAATAIGGVLGGAIGNLMDRVRHGEVVDFLDFRLIGGYIWPTFNMADCWIVVGVALLMIQMFFEPEPEPAAESESGDPALSADARRGTNG